MRDFGSGNAVQDTNIAVGPDGKEIVVEVMGENKDAKADPQTTAVDTEVLGGGQKSNGELPSAAKLRVLVTEARTGKEVLDLSFPASDFLERVAFLLPILSGVDIG